MFSEEDKFEIMIKEFIKLYEPLTAELMHFDGLISLKPYHEWSKGVTVSKNDVQFGKRLKTAIPTFKLPQEQMREIFKETIALHKKGPWIRRDNDQRLFERYIRRPECIAFHRKYGSIPAEMKDPRGAGHRAPKNEHNKRGPGSYLERSNPRRKPRKECRLFHEKYGEFNPSELDVSGRACRSDNRVIWKILTKKP